MKAASRFMSAASAAALSIGLAGSVVAATTLGSVTQAQAASVSRIEVRGNQRVDADTIRNYLGIKPGVSFDNGDVNEAVKRLFSTGLFSDVKINQSGGTLVVSVQEYAVVNQVMFQGNKKLKDNQLTEIVQLKSRGAYSPAMLDADVEAVQAAYRQVGRDDATVTANAQQLSDGRVNVIFQIQEGGKTKIANVKFEGNKAYSDGRLRDLISTKESGLFSFLTRNDLYSEDRLRADEEKLRRFYYNHGYADFRVISSSADLDEASNSYTISITVDEGERYDFGEVNVETTIDGVDTTTLISDVKTRKGKVYKAKDVEDSIIKLTEDLAGRGYAFAEVTPRGDRNFETRQINVTYAVDEGPRAYIQRIEIRGNNRTRDYVIRREFDVGEGDAFNQVMIQQAKKRLERLDYFTVVNVSTVPGSEPDQVVLVVDVVEKPTGEFSIGAGYSTGESSRHGSGFSVEGSITERNFLGRGQYIRLAVAGGRDSRDYTFSFTEPYFLGRRISAGFDVFRRTRVYDYYNREETGATFRLGLPISEDLKTLFAYNISSQGFDFRDDASNPCADPLGVPIKCELPESIRNAILDGDRIKSSVSSSLIYDTIDDYKNPHDGIYANFTTEFAGIGGDAKFVSVTARASYYKTLSDQLDLVGLVKVGGGHIEGYDGGVNVFDQFESSDSIIRGFDFNGIGPYQDRLNGKGIEHLGGKTYLNASAEAQFPLPILPPSVGMRGAVFADAATLFGTDLVGTGIDGTDMAWRASVGIGLIWASPFGPLRINYAVPVLKEKHDEVQNFSFGISTRF